MKVLTYVALIATTLCGSACGSGNLSRAQAEEILRPKFPLSNLEKKTLYVEIAGHCFEQVIGPCRSDAKPASTKALEELGLISVSYRETNSRISITDKGNQYMADPFPRSATFVRGYRYWGAESVEAWGTTSEFGAVTGVSEPDQSQSVTVEFTLLVKSTPFGEFLRHSSIPEIAQNSGDLTMQTRTATFRKYDDGWRLVSTS